MLVALKRKRFDEVKALVDDDPTLVYIPIKASHNEPPLFFALRNKCPVNILEILLCKGASVSEPGLNSLIFLATTSMTNPMERQQCFMPLPFARSACSPNPEGLLANSILQRLDVAPRPPEGFDANHRVPASQLQHQGMRPSSAAEVPADYEVSVAACLLRHGADPFEEDSHGLCAVDYAQKIGKSELADLMQTWVQAQEYRLQCRMDLLGLTDVVKHQVYEYLLPRKQLQKMPKAAHASQKLGT
jgi:hypothetical protein